MPKVKVSKVKLWKAIRSQCLDCGGGSSEVVRSCTDQNCSLYAYRFGRPEKESRQADLKSLDTPYNRGNEAQISSQTLLNV